MELTPITIRADQARNSHYIQAQLNLGKPIVPTIINSANCGGYWSQLADDNRAVIAGLDPTTPPKY